MLRAFYISCIGTRKLPLIWVFFGTLRPQNRTPLKKQKEDRTKTNKTGSSNGWPSFIEFGQPRFPRSDTLSQSGPLKFHHKTLSHSGVMYDPMKCPERLRPQAP